MGTGITPKRLLDDPSCLVDCEAVMVGLGTFALVATGHAPSPRG